MGGRTGLRRVWAGGLATGVVAMGAGASGSPVDSPLGAAFEVDQLEVRAQNGDDVVHWEQAAWLGGEVWRAWIDTSGDLRTGGTAGGEAELQLSTGARLGDRGELRAGVRHDRFFGEGPDRERSFAALDASFATPAGVDLAPALFLSDDGDLSARLTVVGELPITRRLVAQGRFEVNAAAHDVPRYGVARGLNDVELGLRVRYETAAGVAPYLGVSWIQALGNTADLARAGGGDAHTLGAVAGLRLRF